MANKCRNKLTLIGPAEDVTHFIFRADAPGQVYNQDLAKDETPPYSAENIKDAQERSRSVLQFSAFAPIAGYSPGCSYNDLGYKSERDAWGVKWGAYDELFVGSRMLSNYRAAAAYHFATAYHPPDIFLKKASVLYPSIMFFLSYDAERPHRGRWTIQADAINYLIHSEESPDYHKPEAAEYIEDEDERTLAWNKWSSVYYETHDQWVEDATFVTTLERAIQS